MVGVGLAVGAALLAAPFVGILEDVGRNVMRPDPTPKASPTRDRSLSVTSGMDHVVHLAWSAPSGPAKPREYHVFGATSPTGQKRLLGSPQEPRFTHRPLPPGETWYYWVQAVDATGDATSLGPAVSGRSGIPNRTDVNGDGKDDVVTFTRGTAADVYVALSENGRFEPFAQGWHDFFAVDMEIASTGDFDGDGRSDLVTFTKGAAGDVYVSLSDGSRFAQHGWAWHDHFASGEEIPLVGDFNGDGKDDIVAFNRGTAGDALVALSTGSGFADAETWHIQFAEGKQTPAVGDFNGDGRDDIAAFAHDSGEVFVALSTGTAFGPDVVTWHEDFARNGETPAVGDFNGDGRDDVAVFSRGTAADVYVALSDGERFGAKGRWHGGFAGGDQVPGVGDFNGDGKADVIAFTRGETADVIVAESDSRRFRPEAKKWHDNFSIDAEWPQPSQIGTMTG